MRKFTYLLTMLALALGFSVARADVVTPYAYDFSGLGSGKLVSSFAPPGWAHYVDRFQAGLLEHAFVCRVLRSGNGRLWR